MPNTRKRLIEAIASVVCGDYSPDCDEWQPHDCGKCYTNDCRIADLADHLIVNGVTFAEDNNVPSKWIPVTERLPDENGYYLCVVCVSSVNQRKEYRRMILFWEDNVWIDMANCFRTKKPLYWMPLPEPPKGE